jgi:hypothetical protein
MRMPLNVYLWPSGHSGPELEAPGREIMSDAAAMSNIIIFWFRMILFTEMDGLRSVKFLRRSEKIIGSEKFI